MLLLYLHRLQQVLFGRTQHADALFLTHAERPSSFSRSMSLYMVTITCMYMYILQCMYMYMHVLFWRGNGLFYGQDKVMYMYRHMYEYGGGGEGSIKVGSCRTNLNGAATGLHLTDSRLPSRSPSNLRVGEKKRKKRDNGRYLNEERSIIKLQVSQRTIRR